MEREVDISELLELLSSAQIICLDDPLVGVALYNPHNDEEYYIESYVGGIFSYTDEKGIRRNVPAAAVSNWSAIIASNSPLNSPGISGSTSNAQRREAVKALTALSLPTATCQSLGDLNIILEAWHTPLPQTDRAFRDSVYSSIKKMENESGRQRDSFRLGFFVMERWNVLNLDDSPPDFLIQLAYYRRWNKKTKEALEVTSVLERSDADRLFRPDAMAVLATERAAAFMDLYEQTGQGLREAHRFLRYSYKLRGGRSDEHNHNAWKRYRALTER